MQFIKRIGAGVAGLLMLGGTIVWSSPAQASDEMSRPPARSASDYVAKGGDFSPKAIPNRKPLQQPASRVAASGGGSGSGFIWSGVVKGLSSPAADNGCSVFTTVHNPFVSSADAHSLFECSVKFGQNYVETGWYKKTGTSEPTFFTYHWREVNGVRTPTCYNACGWVQKAGATCVPGMSLASAIGTGPKQFYIQHFDGVWWVAYNGEWCGYYPDSLFGGTAPKDRTTEIQFFGEVASLNRAYSGTGVHPDISTDMGASVVPANANAMRIEKAHVVGGSTANDTWTIWTTASSGVAVNPAHYATAAFTNTSDSSLPRNFKTGGGGSY